MGIKMRFALGLVCACLLVMHYSDHFGRGVDAFNFFGTKSCATNDPTCGGHPTSPPPTKDDTNFDFKSAPFMTAASAAVIGLALLFAMRLQRRDKRLHNVIIPDELDMDLDPYDVIQCLRHRLSATETELAEIKGSFVGVEVTETGSDALALVPTWDNDERTVCVKKRGAKSVSSGRSTKSSKEWGKIDLTNADYVRKCKYMAKKLKESESNVKLLRTQITMANDIKTEFDELVEQRSEMGKQIVALTKEKRETRQKITALQVEVRTMRKQIDVVNEQNTVLAKHNEQLGTNLKNALRDKKLAKRQFDDCNEELLLVRKKLDSMHQEKENLVVRIEDLETKILKRKEEPKPVAEKEPETSTKVDMKAFERSLMNLERSVEENLRLRKSAESLYSEQSGGFDDEKIHAIRRDLTRMEEIYRVDTQPNSAHEVSYESSETSISTKDVSSVEEFRKSTVVCTSAAHNDVSVCCLDSTCSVCSKKDCQMLHRSCSDIRCVMPYSEMDVGRGANGATAGRPQVKRVAAIEKLADIFGNEENEYAGLGSALHRTNPLSDVFTRNVSPNESPASSLTKNSLTNMLKDFTTSEESLASTGAYDLSTNKAHSNRKCQEVSPRKKERKSASARSKLNSSVGTYSSPMECRKGGKKVSCFTTAKQKDRPSMEITGCSSQDPEIGDEEVIGDQMMTQLSESATYILGDRGL